MKGKTFQHRWQLYDALSSLTPDWKKLENNKVNKPFNKNLSQQLGYIYSYFELSEETPPRR